MLLDEGLAFLGRLHVVVLHLPIGILVALGLFELRAWWRSSDSPPAAWSLALWGSVGAVVTAVFGLFLSWNGSYDPTLLFRHRWLGIAVATCSVVVFALKAWTVRERAYRGMLALTVLLMMLGGHQGGSLTHGSGFLFASAATPDAPSDLDASAAAFVFETHCYECHGSSQQESGLRLDERGAILAGGESGEPAVVPGRAMASELVRRITLPRDDEDAMPPDGRKRLTGNEMLVLIDWIQAGAPLERAIEIEAAPAGVLDELAATGIDIEQLSENDPRLSVSLQFAPDEAPREPLLLLARVAPQTTWLDLKGRTLSDAEWAELSRFENLTRLHLEQTNVEDEHLEPLARALHLEYVNVYDTNVGDDGVAHLSGLPALTDVYVWHSRVSDDGIAEFLENNPKVRIHR